MRAFFLACLVVIPVAAGGCFFEDDPTVFGSWSASDYGFGGSCYMALGGETVHVAARYDGGDTEQTFDCAELQFQLSVPRGVTNVTIDVWGDSGRYTEGSTSVPLAPGAMEQSVDIGHVSVN